MQAIQLGLPLFALPWLSRKLGTDAFGLLMYMSLIPPICALISDWGLSLFAARDAAKNKHYPACLKTLLGAVYSAKIILAVLCFAGGTILLFIIPHASSWPLTYYCTIFLGVTRSTTPLWFFQGTGQKIEQLAIFDITATVSALCLIVAFISKPDEWPLYFFIMLFCKGVVYYGLIFQLWRHFLPRINFKEGINILKKSYPIFISSSITMLYLFCSQLILGYFLSSSQMGIFVAINKMIRAMVSLSYPVTQTIFPKICAIGALKRTIIKQLLCFSIGTTAIFMSIAAICAWFCAPILIKIALGSQYMEAIPVFRIMLWATPLMATSQAFGAQALVALGLEKLQARILAFTGTAGLILACILPSIGGLIAAAYLPLCVETGILCAYLILFSYYWHK